MGWTRPIRKYGRSGLCFALLFALVADGGPRASGQVWATLSNAYLTVDLGESGQENSQNVTGRFKVIDKATGNTILLGPVNDTFGTGGTVAVPGSFLTVRIDGGPTGVGPAGTPGTDL